MPWEKGPMGAGLRLVKTASFIQMEFPENNKN
jgi:hypothetical protein